MCSPPSDSQARRSPEPPIPAPEGTRWQVVHHLHAANGWALLDAEALAALVVAAAPPNPTPAALEAIARDQYSRVLWQACRPSAEPARRQVAYTELQRLLFRAAYNRRPELAADGTQRALELVVADVERCREPGAFVAFALFKLRQALKEEAAFAARGAPANPPPETATAPDVVPDDAARHERAAALAAAIGQLHDSRQRIVVVLKFYWGLDDQTIAARLEITPGYVRVLRHHALRRLRADPALARLLADDE